MLFRPKNDLSAIPLRISQNCSSQKTTKKEKSQSTVSTTVGSLGTVQILFQLKLFREEQLAEQFK